MRGTPLRSALTAAAIAAAVAACGDDNGPSAGEPELIRARFAAADPPPEGEDYAAQVSSEPGRISADVLLRADVACSTVGAGIEAADTLLLVIQTTQRSGCQPVAGGILVETVIVGVPDEPPPFRIEWWRGADVDTVWQSAD